MAPIHYRALYSDEEEFIVLHPHSPPLAHREVSDLPGYATEQYGPATVVRYNQRTLLFTFLRDQGFTICRKCTRRLYCQQWDDAWLAQTGLSLVPAFKPPEKPPQWRTFFDEVLVFFTARKVVLSNAERLLGLHPPYTREDVLAAHKRALLVHHPDRGGHTEVMAQLNVARDELVRALTPVVDEAQRIDP